MNTILKWSFVRNDDNMYGLKPPATMGSAGIDLSICENQLLEVDKLYKLPTNIRVEIPTGYCGLIMPRSSNLKNGINVEMGLIDSDYRGEIFIQVRLSNEIIKSKTMLPAGYRVAQLVIVPYCPTLLVQVDSLSETSRNANGFGSTGTTSYNEKYSRDNEDLYSFHVINGTDKSPRYNKVDKNDEITKLKEYADKNHCNQPWYEYWENNSRFRCKCFFETEDRTLHISESNYFFNKREAKKDAAKKMVERLF